MKNNEPPFSSETIRRVRRNVRRWFTQAKRPLPWRDNPTGYRVWIAEIMAQQTRIETMLPYYHRWLKAFPDVAALAAAPLDDVLRHWAGLGYYNRARNLHRAAQLLVDKHDGHLPGDPEILQTLPGIGRYTAGAIASLAFGIPAPILDGNVMRVLTRLLDISDDITRSSTTKRLWDIATRLTPKRDPGPFNEGLMELGALICTPQSPACHRCPLRNLCLAHQRGVSEDRPVRPPKKNVPQVRIAAAVVRRSDGAVLIVQNEYERLFGGLWQFPQHPHDFSIVDKIGKRSLASALHAHLGRPATVGKKIGHIEHVLSHRRLHVDVYEAALADERLTLTTYRDFRWLQREPETQGLALASFTRKILRLVSWQTPPCSG